MIPLAFNAPLAQALQPAQVSVELYRYDWFWEYGSPERDTHRVEVTQVECSDDRTRVRIRAPEIEPGWVARVVLSDVRSSDGRTLLHDEFANADLKLFESKRNNTRPIKAGYALKQHMYCEPVSYSTR